MNEAERQPMRDEQKIELGQQWRAVAYTAPDPVHLLYTVEKIDGGMITLHGDQGQLSMNVEAKMLAIYMDLVGGGQR